MRILYFGINNENYASKQYTNILKRIGDLEIFDYRQYLLNEGKDKMNDEFVLKVVRYKPDIIFFPYVPDELCLDNLLLLKRYMNTKTFLIAGDDDCMFESSTRFHSLFFDYMIVCQLHLINKYKKDKRFNTLPSLIYDDKTFIPKKLEKTNEVLFYGIPEHDRNIYLSYLIDNGVNVSIYGRGWEELKQFKDHYKGILPMDNLVDEINKSKIVLNFSKNKFGEPHYKGRLYETGCCKVFQLVEYFKEYKKIKGLVMFKNKEELLKLIKYYQNNEKEKKKSIDLVYKQVINKGFYYDLTNLIKSW